MAKKDYKNIAKQIGVSYIFTLLSFVIGPVLLFILTRNLSVAEYGVYSILSVTIMVISLLLNMSTHIFIITKLPGLKRLRKVSGMASIFLFETVIGAAAALLLFIASLSKSFLSFIRMGSYGLELRLSAGIIFLGLLCYILGYYLAADRKIGMQAFYSFMYNKLWIIFLIAYLFIFKEFSLFTVFLLWLAGTVISLAALLVSLNKDISFFFSKVRKISADTVRKAVAFGMPLVPASICGLLISFADRYMINLIGDEALTGLYSLAYSLVFIIPNVSLIISNVIYPYLSKAWNEKKEHHIFFNAILKYNLAIIIPASVGLFVLREQIITLISGVEYLPAAAPVAILCLVTMLVFLTDLYFKNIALRDKTKLMGWVYLGGAAINIFLNYFLIRAYGISGAAWSTVISYILMVVVLHLVNKNQFSWDYRFLKLGRIIAASAIMGIIVYLINPQEYLAKILSIAIGVVLYFSLLAAFKAFDEREYSIIIGILPLPGSLRKTIIKMINTKNNK